MNVEITQTDNQVTVTLEGRLDTVTSSEFEKKLVLFLWHIRVSQRKADVSLYAISAKKSVLYST